MGINWTNVTLIPKVQGPEYPDQFRPISLCNVSYRILSKILANRLRPLLDKIISPTQSAFVKGRKISYITSIAHRIIMRLNKK